MRTRDTAKRWILLLVVLTAMLVAAGCERSSAIDGYSRLRAPSMTDPDDITSTFIESPAYHWASPP